MKKAYFIVREGLVPGTMMTCHGPFNSEAEALAIAPQLQPATYTIYGDAAAGKSFTIGQPAVTFNN